MADEFAKGFGILTTSGLIWMVLAAWYNTPSFEETQFIQPPPADIGTYGELALTVKEAAFWFAILGALTFWVVIPLGRAARESMAEGQ
jgi:hypothetical protein